MKVNLVDKQETNSKTIIEVYMYPGKVSTK